MRWIRCKIIFCYLFCLNLIHFRPPYGLNTTTYLIFLMLPPLNDCRLLFLSKRLQKLRYPILLTIQKFSH